MCRKTYAAATLSAVLFSTSALTPFSASAAAIPGVELISTADAMCTPVIPNSCPCGMITSNTGCITGANMYLCPCAGATPVGPVTGVCVDLEKCLATGLPGGGTIFSSIGAFMKENALVLGLGVGIAGGILPSLLAKKDSGTGAGSVGSGIGTGYGNNNFGLGTHFDPSMYNTNPVNINPTKTGCTDIDRMIGTCGTTPSTNPVFGDNIIPVNTPKTVVDAVANSTENTNTNTNTNANNTSTKSSSQNTPPSPTGSNGVIVTYDSTPSVPHPSTATQNIVWAQTPGTSDRISAALKGFDQPNGASVPQSTSRATEIVKLAVNGPSPSTKSSAATPANTVTQTNTPSATSPTPETHNPDCPLVPAKPTGKCTDGFWAPKTELLKPLRKSNVLVVSCQTGWFCEPGTEDPASLSNAQSRSPLLGSGNPVQVTDIVTRVPGEANGHAPLLGPSAETLGKNSANKAQVVVPTCDTHTCAKPMIVGGPNAPKLKLPLTCDTNTCSKMLWRAEDIGVAQKEGAVCEKQTRAWEVVVCAAPAPTPQAHATMRPDIHPGAPYFARDNQVAHPWEGGNNEDWSRLIDTDWVAEPYFLRGPEVLTIQESEDAQRIRCDAGTRTCSLSVRTPQVIEQLKSLGYTCPEQKTSLEKITCVSNYGQPAND